MSDIEANTSRNLLLVWLGLAQGAVLYALYQTHKAMLWPLEWSPLFNAVLLAVLLLPFVVYWAHAILNRRALFGLLLIMGLLTLGVGAYQSATLFPFPNLKKPQLVDFPVFFGLALVSFMMVPLVSAWSKQRRDGFALGHWDYAALFEHAWRNAVITVQAGVLTGLVWTVLQLGAQLFRLIGVDWPHEVIEEAWFAIPVTTLSFALSMRAGLKRSAFVVTLRNHWLTLTAWLLPLVGLIGSAFVLTSMTGVDKLFERGLSAFFLLWFAAFWVKFFNSAFQDGQHAPPFGAALQKILLFTAIALLAIVGLATWALLLRVSQHGLTPDRIWGLLVALVAWCYGAGYSLSLVRNTHWMSSIAHANVLAALLMCVGIMALLSPIFDARKLSTDNQMARFHAGQGPPGKLDVRALAQQGSFGHDALQSLAQQKDAKGEPTLLALRAKEAIEFVRQYRHYGFGDSPNEAHELPVSDLRERLDVYPKGALLPEDFVAFLKADILTWDSWIRRDSCFDQNDKVARCSLLQVDLNRDGQPEMILWKTRYERQPRVYSKTGQTWKRTGYLEFSKPPAHSLDIQTQLMTEGFTSSPSAWDELSIGDSRYFVLEDDRNR